MDFYGLIDVTIEFISGSSEVEIDSSPKRFHRNSLELINVVGFYVI